MLGRCGAPRGSRGRAGPGAPGAAAGAGAAALSGPGAARAALWLRRRNEHGERREGERWLCGNNA